jgi:autotransporter translocation and assembly factor TamB
MKWLRLLLGVLLGAAALIALGVVALLGPLRARTLEFARPRIEATLAVVLNVPVAIAALRATLAPFRIEADGVSIGENGALARAQHVRIDPLLRTSLRQLRPVADVTVDSAAIDLPGWTAWLERRPAGPPSLLPPFRVRLVSHAPSVRLTPGDDGFLLAAAHATAELTSAAGRLRFSATAESGMVSRGNTALGLEYATARGREAATGGWWLEEVQVVGDGIELHSATAEGDRLPIHGRVALPRLAIANPTLERLAGEAEFDVALIGPLEHARVGGTLRVADLIGDGERLGDLSATAELTAQAVTVSALHVAGAGGEVDASGTLTLRDPLAYTAHLRWSALDVRQLARLEPASAAGKPIATSGQADLSGTLAPIAVQVAGTGSFAAPGAEPVAWQGRGTYRDGVGDSEVEFTQTGGNGLNAHIAVDAQQALRGSIETVLAQPTALAGFAPIESLPNLSGSFSASAQIAGTLADPQLAGQLAGRNLVLLGVTVEQLGGSFSADRAALRTAGVSANLGQGSLALSGTIALGATVQNDWQLRAQHVAGDTIVALVYGLTGTTAPIGRGTLDASVDARGPWARAQLSAAATMQQFWLSSEWIQQATLSARVTWPQWQIEAGLHNLAGQAVTAQGSGSGTDNVTIAANSERWDLTALQRGELTEMGGTLALRAAFSGPLRALNGRAALQARDLIISGRRLETVDLDAEANRGRWQASATLLDGTLVLRAALAPETGWPFTLDGEWKEARIGRFLVPDSDVWVVTSGRLHVGARLTALAQFDASASVDALRIVNGPYELAAPRAAQVECRRGTCTLDALELRGTNTELRASGTLGTNGAIQLAITGKGDLRLLELSGGIESARGPFTIDVSLRRVGSSWDIGGSMAFEQATLDVGARLAVTRASGRLELSGTTVRIARMGGRMGTGTFSLEGSVDLSRGPDLIWTLTDVGANLAPSLEVEFSSRGSLSGSWQHMQLGGRVDVARMLYDRDLELTDILPRLNRTLAEAPRPPSARLIELDLRIIAPGELYVENNIARIEARADLHITGTLATPVLDGRIEVLDGQVTFNDRVFEIQGGTVDLRPDLGLAAALNISAESTIETTDATYIVDVLVTGTTREPRVMLSSDDASLTQTDLATLIAVGQTTTQMREGGGSISIGKQLSTKQLLPIDRISFESSYSHNTGTFEPQLKLGKDLSDALAVSVGQTFGVASRTSTEADYRLTPRIYLTGSWESQTSNQEGAFAAGVKVRYQFWRVTPFTLLAGGLR